MRGASAESVATLTEALEATVDAGADATRLADDLLGVAAILRREAGLRRIATDVSIAPAAKSDLVRQVFGSQLAPASLDLVAQAAGRRWAGSRDLGDALEKLGVIAVVRGADDAGQADALEDELFGFSRLVSQNPELRDALSDPARSAEDKRTLLHGLLEGRVTAATMRLAEQSVAGFHRTVAVALEEYQKVAAQHRNRLVATVRVARELPAADEQRLQGALARQYGKPVHLNVVVDPRVVGGMSVEIGDDVIDGTVSSRLDEARRRLAG
ncbi:F0F1 ATP synthase subunit delta [Nocardioides mesophilus]|uniref:ATP synthase subunit delta n=1 Tax=Nocardioides mesophilus TaxID=433659 RepID=A0A7G9R8N9_9ACTN|nr:F0F1 ATP synthase subunit delta [Nocardioides mesophilus]QNN51964.1 F0F1 ATP synthase subunit delta [Nocardioides mesophilus]